MPNPFCAIRLWRFPGALRLSRLCALYGLVVPPLRYAIAVCRPYDRGVGLSRLSHLEPGVWAAGRVYCGSRLPLVPRPSDLPLYRHRGWSPPIAKRQEVGRTTCRVCELRWGSNPRRWWLHPSVWPLVLPLNYKVHILGRTSDSPPIRSLRRGCDPRTGF